MLDDQVVEDFDDTASNPHAKGHLPVSGEFDAKNIPDDENPLSTEAGEDEDDINTEIEKTNDMNEISAEKTDDIAEAPDPEGPANPTATGIDDAEGLASGNNVK